MEEVEAMTRIKVGNATIIIDDAGDSWRDDDGDSWRDANDYAVDATNRTIYAPLIFFAMLAATGLVLI